ncbi:hypothetical protein BCV69DRAFT_281672 [Microstroma glucosiphilum]|uniref:REJ domain-containing protein n=1 Tax=Pseudomicrostroma glucosiphilum TaxID=1684307 RepID=A0A316UBG2_9BASI|nr:hypothetical protein BCV69DRAFT_281672 [Pseudomicrostroma glucosiphilum]PWN21743.1 hypothetical protein BCV69DRAFT_281672 [Pseudomicrostroma glucosiphilum]
MASCGSSVATATLFRTTTTSVPTVVVSTVLTPVTLTLAVGGAPADGSSDDDDDSYTTTSVSTSTALSTITSSYATVLTIPTATLYSTGECPVASTSAPTATSALASSKRVTATSLSASTVQSTSTVTSALATVSDESGSTSIVFITYTQTMSSMTPVVVTVVEGPAASETSVTQTTTSQGHNNTSAIVGGAVGSVAGLLLLALLVWFGLRRRRRYKDQQGLDDLFQRSNGHMGTRAEGGTMRRGLTRDDSQYSKGVEAGQTSSGDQSVEEDMAELAQQPHSSLAIPTLAHHSQPSTEPASGMPPSSPPSYGGQTFPPAWPLNIDTQAAIQSYDANGQPYSPPANSSQGNHAHNPYVPAYPVHPVLDRSGSSNSRLSYYHDAPDRKGTPPIALAESAKMAAGSRPPLSTGRQSTSSIHLSPPSSPPLTPHIGGAQNSVGTPPFFASPRYFPNPASTRPRSIADELDRSLARQGTAPAGGESPHFSPPSRPSSPPTHLSPRFRQSSFGPPSAGNPAKALPSGSQLSPRAASPLMWKTPAPQGSTDSPGALPPPRPRNASSGNLMQMRKSFHASGRQSSQDQMPTAGALAATSAFGVQTAATPRRATASPPPFSYDGNWPPSRYGHLDMAGHRTHGGEAAAITAPDGQLSPNLRPVSPSVSPRPSHTSLQGVNALNIPSVAPSDSEHFWRTPSTGVTPTRLDPPVDLDRKPTSVAPSSRSISPVLRGEDNAVTTPSGVSESTTQGQAQAQGSRRENKWSQSTEAEEMEEEGELREAERNLVWGPGGKRHTLFVANED